MKLVIGNKNYSSWSLRPWLAMKHTGIVFDEIRLSFNSPTFKRDVLQHSPAGRVPVLIDGDTAVWDSLAIAEYLAERFPEKKLWPQDPQARALARSICAEMHAGFTALRGQMSMNVTAELPGRGWNVTVQQDIDRIVQSWSVARQRFGTGGPFLFGAFTNADAYYAPVVTRFRTYAVAVPPLVRDYMQAVLEMAAMREWIAGAASENDFVAEDEAYRLPPA